MRASRTRSWPSSRTAATSRMSRNRRPSSTRSENGYGAAEERYSPECVEGEFCELRIDGVLGRSLSGQLFSSNFAPEAPSHGRMLGEGKAEEDASNG